MRKYLVFLPLMISCNSNRLGQSNIMADGQNNALKNPLDLNLSSKAAGVFARKHLGLSEDKQLFPYMIKNVEDINEFSCCSPSRPTANAFFIKKLADYFVFDYKDNIASMFDLLIEAKPTQFVQGIFKALIKHKGIDVDKLYWGGKVDLLLRLAGCGNKVLFKILLESGLPVYLNKKYDATHSRTLLHFLINRKQTLYEEDIEY
ncbi:MAG: hypothetical protein NMK33_04080 [Candidatus Cardinium sp.]|uniref:hypothetical protein n=1 Tax=Cardinium endosymbiont of Dermatophagoides farinae TaxID=2597823 RepID=UPI001183583F|nr:hypothetical protein [Cardinium endosymbiont of Dermatophagoides farinae]TSJ80617.1 hypothetical protein FPG78_00805 [Cardinium endosymbiont of Dermatophagoides farinae]UWW96609.1 MAG: hypothetical protein NMK33_04080 [Candidatus Cardinium sp.]